MSTKTSIKRIALVAVAGLGLGLVTSVAANAAAATATAVSPTTTQAGATAGTNSIGTVTFGAIGNGAADTIAVNVLTGPAGGVLTVAVVGSDNGTDTTHTVGAGAANYTESGNGDAAGALDIKGSFSLPGTYTVAWGTTTTVTGTYVVTGQKNSIAPLVGDGFSKTAANATNGSTLNGVAGAFNTVTVGLVSGTGVALTGGNTWGTSGVRTMVSVSGAGATISSSTNATVATDKLSAVTSTSNMTFASNPGAIVINTPSAGTITVKSYLETANGSGIFSTTADQTITVTVNAASQVGLFDAANSTATMTASGSATISTDAKTVTAPKTSAVQGASIAVALASVSGNLASTTTTLTITGPGYLTVSNGNSNSTGRSLTETGTDAAYDVAVIGDGSSGTATVTITNGAFSAVRTVVFYGAVATISVKSVKSSLSDAASATIFATLSAKDSAGTAVPLAAADGSPSTTNGTFTDATGSTAGTVDVSLAPTADSLGAKTSVWTHTATGLTVDLSVLVAKATASTITIAGPADTLVPGQMYTITVTSKDVNGYANPDGSRNLTISTSRASSVTVPTAGNFVNGVASIDLYAPATVGDFTITVTDATTTTATATITVPVSNSSQDAIDAANEATDAANAATDAANAAAEAADAATAAAQDAQAAVAALATEVASMIAGIKAQITSLTNLIIKIKNKVKA
jgi:hypothetical protein